MMYTRTVNISKRSSYLGFFDSVTVGSRKLYNTANYLIRNLRSAMYKASKGIALSNREEDVLLQYRKACPVIKKNLAKRFFKTFKKIPKRGIKNRGMIKKALKNAKSEPLCYGNANMVYGYSFLDAYLKDTKNHFYYGLPSQVNQQVLRKLAKDWKSYFKSIKKYRKDPSGYTGKPKPPKYKKDQAVATFTNQVAKLFFKNGMAWITFTDKAVTVCMGAEADLFGLKYVRTEVLPYYGSFKVCVTFKDDLPEVKVPKNPNFVLGIDHGIDNFMACFSNNPQMPAFLYKGYFIKSQNRWFNKRKAKLVSELTKGSKTKHKADSKALRALSVKRDAIFGDYFYKCAHDLCRKCVLYSIEVIVVGNNSLWKQASSLGKVNNQNFVSIPFYRFGQILESVARKYDIPVVFREESYTSMASLCDKDPIPVYEKAPDDENKTDVKAKKAYTFSGIRTKKAYILKDNITINADINGAGNIARKEYPDAFNSTSRHDLIECMKNIQTIKYKDLYTLKPRKVKAYRSSVNNNRRIKRNERLNKKISYKMLFAA